MEKDPGSTKETPTYETPEVERVIDREDLEREVHYAGLTPAPS